MSNSMLMDSFVGSTNQRMNGYAIGRQNGWMSANDEGIRKPRPYSSEDGGDLYLINGNMLPLNRAGAFAGVEGGEEEP